jgi:hypothetical protein
LQPCILITDIVKPDLLDIYYEIDVGTVSGATVTWASLPSGVTLVNLGSGKYRITNIDTVAQWTAVRNPTVNIPSGWQTNFTYTAGIYYEPSKSKVWTNSVAVTVRAQITSTASLTGSITGIQKSFVSMQAAATVSKSIVGKIQRASAQFTSAGTTVVRGRYAPGRLRSDMTSTSTVVARRTFVASARAALTAFNAISCSIKVFYLHKGQATVVSTATLAATPNAFKGIVNTTLAQTGSVLTATANDIIVSVSITTGVDVDKEIFGMYRDKFRASGTWPTRWMFGTAVSIDGETRRGVEIDLGYATEAELLIDSGSDAESVDTFSGNSDMSRIAFSAVDDFSGDAFGSDIYFYDRSGTTWTRTNKITNSTASRFDTNLSMSRNGQFLAHTFQTSLYSPYPGKIVVYEYSAGSWSQINSFDTTGYASNPAVRISDNGNYLFLHNGGITDVYFRSGGTYTLQQSITAGDGANNESFAITSAGDYFVVGEVGGSDEIVSPRTLGQATTLVGSIASPPTIVSGIPDTSNFSVVGGIVVNSIAGFTPSGYIQIGNEIFRYSSITTISNRFEGINRAAGDQPAATHTAGTGVYQVVNPIIQTITTQPKIMVYKRTGTTWALEQTLYSEGIWTVDFGRHIAIDGTINHIQVLGNATTSGFRNINFVRV